MGKEFLMMLIFLISLISLTMYVNELGIPHEGVEAKFLDFGDQTGQKAEKDGSSIRNGLQKVQKAQNGEDTESQEVQNPKSNVDSGQNRFTVEIVEVKETALLSREVKARLTNNDGDAKNVRVKFELKVDGQRIKINGKDYLLLYLGDMGKGESVERKVEVSIDFFDGMTIKNKGYLDAVLTVIYEGGSESTTYRLNV